jgi:hypothetical protein
VLQSSVCHNSLDVYLSDSRFQVPRQAHRVRLISLPRAALKLRTRPLVHLYLVFAAKQFEKMVQCSIHADRQMKAVSLGGAISFDGDPKSRKRKRLFSRTPCRDQDQAVVRPWAGSAAVTKGI